uniref:Uncharacterized protein n=1 Tax=Asparagus officinalis TaxID=4686 RepID=Q2XNZ6_ASPOF|nr:hypothetical protein 10.t00005 [Asparagus officinalis]
MAAKTPCLLTLKPSLGIYRKPKQNGSGKQTQPKTASAVDRTGRPRSIVVDRADRPPSIQQLIQRCQTVQENAGEIVERDDEQKDRLIQFSACESTHNSHESTHQVESTHDCHESTHH